MSLSAFTPLGMWGCSGATSYAERIYKSAVTSLKKAYDTSPGTRADAWCFANAMMLARTKYAAEHAAGQALPATIDVLLPPIERAYGIVPGPADNVIDRRVAYAVRRQVPKAPSRFMVETNLRMLLGADFLATIPTAVANVVLFPTMIADPPMLMRLPSIARKVLKLLEPVFPDTSGPVRYQSLLDTGDEASGLLAVGESFVLEPETLGIAEIVTVTGIGTDADGVPTFTAVYFETAHSEGAIGAVQPYAAQASSKRHTLVVLSQAAAANASAVRKVNEFMARCMRATATWSIVGGVAGATGVFTIESSPLGAQTIGTVSY